MNFKKLDLAEPPLSTDWPLTSSPPPLPGKLWLSAGSMPSHRDMGPEAAASSMEMHQVTCPQVPRKGNLHFRVMGGSSLPLASLMRSAFFLKSIGKNITGLEFQKIRVNKSCRQLLLAAWPCSSTEATKSQACYLLEQGEGWSGGGKKNEYFKIQLSPQGNMCSAMTAWCVSKPEPWWVVLHPLTSRFESPHKTADSMTGSRQRSMEEWPSGSARRGSPLHTSFSLLGLSYHWSLQ